MKKIFSVALSAVMVGGMMIGAGSTVMAEENGELFEIPIWSSDASCEAAMTELINNYNETAGKEAGIKLTYTVSSELSTLLELGKENGDLPLITDDWGKEVTYEDGGYLYPIAKLPGGQEFLDAWAEKVGPYTEWNKISGSNDIYHITYSTGGPAVYYNKDMFKAAGIVDENGEAKAPSTWAEFLKDCEILTTGDTYGLALQGQWGSCAEYAVLYNAYTSSETLPLEVDWDNLTVKFNCAEPFETIAEIYQKGYCVPGAETVDNDPARSFFSEGVAGMFLGYSWDLGVFTSQYVADFDWDVCWLGAEDGTMYGTNLGLGPWFGVTSAVADLTEEEQTKVMEALKWLYSDEVGVPLVEAGLKFPANNDFYAQANTDSLSVQTVKYLDTLSKGRVNPKVEQMWNNVDYENGHGAGLINDSLFELCKGEITIDELSDSISQKFTESLQTKVEDGTLDPEDWK